MPPQKQHEWTQQDVNYLARKIINGTNSREPQFTLGGRTRKFTRVAGWEAFLLPGDNNNYVLLLREEGQPNKCFAANINPSDECRRYINDKIMTDIMPLAEKRVNDVVVSVYKQIFDQEFAKRFIVDKQVFVPKSHFNYLKEYYINMVNGVPQEGDMLLLFLPQQQQQQTAIQPPAAAAAVDNTRVTQLENVCKDLATTSGNMVPVVNGLVPVVNGLVPVVNGLVNTSANLVTNVQELRQDRDRHQGEITELRHRQDNFRHRQDNFEDELTEIRGLVGNIGLQEPADGFLEALGHQERLDDDDSDDGSSDPEDDSDDGSSDPEDEVRDNDAHEEEDGVDFGQEDDDSDAVTPRKIVSSDVKSWSDTDDGKPSGGIEGGVEGPRKIVSSDVKSYSEQFTPWADTDEDDKPSGGIEGGVEVEGRRLFSPVQPDEEDKENDENGIQGLVTAPSVTDNVASAKPQHERARGKRPKICQTPDSVHEEDSW